MAESLGDVIDKFVTVSMKLWFTQDEIHKAAREGKGLSPEVTKRVVDLNLRRAKLTTEIDQKLADAVGTGKVDVDQRYKLT